MTAYQILENRPSAIRLLATPQPAVGVGVHGDDQGDRLLVTVTYHVKKELFTRVKCYI